MRKLLGVTVALTVISGCVAIPAWLAPGPFGRNLLIALSLFSLVFGASSWIDARRRRRCREPFLLRSRMPDEAFLRETECPPENHHVALAMRGILAEMGLIPAETVYPSDTIADLFKLQSDNGDLLDFVFHLEKRLGVRVPRRLPEGLDLNVSIGRFAGRLSLELKAR